MIELSAEQIVALENGENPPGVVNSVTREEYVLVSRKVYDRLRLFLTDDFSSDDAFRAQIESAAAAGWDDPALDVYN